MSPFTRRKKSDADVSTRPDYLDGFLAQPADVGTSEADVAAVAQADADRAAKEARVAQFVKTEGALDQIAPRPPVLGIDFFGRDEDDRTK
jgi:hypothetical protein